MYNERKQGVKHMSWKCEICGRTFRNKNQNHSCNARSVDAAFSGNGRKWLIKYLQTSANRVVHKIAVADNSGFGEILDWIVESYVLTQR